MDKNAMVTEAVRLLDTEGTWAALQFFEHDPDPAQAAHNCDAVMNHLYWQKHDLAAVIGLGLPAIQRALTQANAQEHRSAELRQAARYLTYNIASFAWTGWDEPGITIDATAQAMGYEAARLNLDLLCKYEPEPLKLARGYAMLGYHLLARDAYDAAIENFMASAEHAETASATAEQKLAIGFVALTHHLVAPTDDAIEQQLVHALAALDCEEDGAAYKTQIETAKRVFTSRAV